MVDGERELWRETFPDGRSVSCRVERTALGAFLLSVWCGEMFASELVYDEREVERRSAALREQLLGGPRR